MLCIQRDFDAAQCLAAIEADRLNAAWLAPVMTTSILTLPDRERYDVSSLRWAIGGGEKTPEARIRAFSQYFTNARYIDAYGLTETGGGDTFMEPGWKLQRSDRPAAPSPMSRSKSATMRAIALPPARTAKSACAARRSRPAIGRIPRKPRPRSFGDWFRSGDVGYLDDDGFLYLTDRKKDMIISGGENIASSEVERVIYELPQVREVAVIGMPDERWGERPVAIVVLADGAALELPDLTDHCRKRLAAFKVPKQLIIRDSLPRNPSGKVLKRVLRAELEASA